MLFSFIIIILFSNFSYAAQVIAEPKIKNLAGKIADDDLMQDLFNQEQNREISKAEKNRSQLKELENNLKKSIDTGMVENEQCIRNSISVLRTVNYVYDWVEEQLRSKQEKKIRLASLDDLVRIRYLNTIYQNSFLAIEECRLQNNKAKVTKREIIKDVADAKIEKIKDGVKIPEHYEGAIVPFR